MQIFGREPAQWAMLINVVMASLLAFVIHVNMDQQGAIMAVITLVMGIVVAAMTHDGLSAAILGMAKAVLSLALAFGLHWNPSQQALILSLVAVVTGMFIRTQVTAPVPPTS
jgi:hypothetical protein